MKILPLTVTVRGKPSTTYPLVLIGFAAVLFRFVVAGHFGYSDMDGTDFGVALAAVGGIWLWREGRERIQ
jgi:hypothetical protein